MNDQTSILGRARQRGGGKGGVTVATARRSLLVLAFVLLFLAVGSVPGRETGAQGFALQATSKAAGADTLAGAGKELADENLLSTRTRHKTH